ASLLGYALPCDLRSFPTRRSSDLFVSASASLGVASDQVFRKDMQTGAVVLVSVNTNTGNPAPGNSVIGANAVSEDGRYVIFKSRSEEHTSELQSRENLVCRLLLEK